MSAAKKSAPIAEPAPVIAPAVLEEVAQDAEKHAASCGGPKVLVNLKPHDWLTFISTQVDRAQEAVNEDGGASAYRDRLVKIAARALVAISAVDSYLAKIERGDR